MDFVLETFGLGKRYRSSWAVQDCTLQVPAGRIVGLVGPNGAGKTTLLQLAVGLLKPTEGQVHITGLSPSRELQTVLQRVGFLAQNRPFYPNFTVHEMLTLGRKLNPRWDDTFARQRLEEQGIQLGQQMGRLSGGQQAQVVLTITLAKRPQLLLLDEPVANLDPLARRAFHQTLLSTAAQGDLTVVLSSHLVTDLDRTCDYLIILSASRVQVASDIEQLIEKHKWVTVPREQVELIKQQHTVLQESRSGQMSQLLVCINGLLNPEWLAEPVSLEDIILAYLAHPTANEGRLESRRNKQEVWQ